MRGGWPGPADFGIDDTLVATLGMRQVLLRSRGILVGQVREPVKRGALLHAEQAQHGNNCNERKTKAAQGVHGIFQQTQNIQEFAVEC